MEGWTGGAEPVSEALSFTSNESLSYDATLHQSQVVQFIQLFVYINSIEAIG